MPKLREPAVMPEPEPESVPVHVAAAMPPAPEPVIEEPSSFVAFPPLDHDPEPRTSNQMVSDIRQLPPLTKTIEQRYGVDRMVINMLSPASTSRPYGHAIINRIKVSIGDYISGSRLKLAEVESHGIAVDAGGSRYYVAF